MTASTMILAGAAALLLQAPPNVNLTWNGSLLDDSCRTTQAAAAKCQVEDNTKMFGVQTQDGKYFKLDPGGNGKVLDALSSSAKKRGDLKISVSGSLDGETIKVDALEIR